MIDRKKIAEKLRKIAEDCAISGSIAVNKTNAALYAAADELDPPEPKPLLANARVGDWVTDGAVQGRMVTRTSDTTWVEVQDGKQYHIETSHLRKLNPSEVVIHIGCLSGTVERLDGNPQHWFWLRSSEYNYALISIDMLDTPTRELVQSLLKAQEEI